MDTEYLINNFQEIWSENKLVTEKTKKDLLIMSNEMMSKYKSTYRNSKSLNLLANIFELDKTHIEESQTYQQLFFSLMQFIGVVILSSDPQNGAKLLKEIEKNIKPNLEKITSLEKMSQLYINALEAEIPNIT